MLASFRGEISRLSTAHWGRGGGGQEEGEDKDRRLAQRRGGERQVDQGRTTAGSLTLAAAINKHMAEANGAWQLINTLSPAPPGDARDAWGEKGGHRTRGRPRVWHS